MKLKNIIPLALPILAVMPCGCDQNSNNKHSLVNTPDSETAIEEIQTVSPREKEVAPEPKSTKGRPYLKVQNASSVDAHSSVQMIVDSAWDQFKQASHYDSSTDTFLLMYPISKLEYYREMKEPTLNIYFERLSEADRLNGYSFKASVTLEFSAVRDYYENKHIYNILHSSIVFGSTEEFEKPGWSSWKPGVKYYWLYELHNDKLIPKVSNIMGGHAEEWGSNPFRDCGKIDTDKIELIRNNSTEETKN